jgi:small subunit ribosomal protein S6
MSTVRQYELVYITPPEITEEALGELHQQVAAVVDRFGGTIEKTENWGRRRLAYEINRQREGVYVLEVINGPGTMLTELDRRLRVVDQVVRHMLVRVDEDLAVAERARTHRKTRMAARRVKRGLPPEPTETELNRRHQEDEDMDGDMFRSERGERGDRGDRGDRERGDRGDR